MEIDGHEIQFVIIQAISHEKVMKFYSQFWLGTLLLYGYLVVLFVVALFNCEAMNFFRQNIPYRGDHSHNLCAVLRI